LRQSYRVLGTTLAKGKPLPALRRGDKPLALVLGNEEEGLPQATLAACDEVLTIPGAGRVQSLNVSASAAVLIYALQQMRE
jgi:TrmH RNA methyltransferase